MGGYRSGRAGWRPVAEQSLAFRISRMREALQALDDPRAVRARGSVEWTDRGGYVASISYVAERAAYGLQVRLVYRYNGEPVDDAIRVTTTQPNYGGRRFWWLCPRCFRRVGVLFAPGSRWRCRTCHRITYTSSNESHSLDAMARMLGCDPAILKYMQERNRGY